MSHRRSSRLVGLPVVPAAIAAGATDAATAAAASAAARSVAQSVACSRFVLARSLSDC